MINELPGNITSVERIGDKVHRGTNTNTPAVHALLRHLETAGYSGSPRVYGYDATGREILTYIEGDVPTMAELASADALAAVGALLRDLHRVTASFTLPPGLEWKHSLASGDDRIVCHNDIAPRNTIFRDGLPVALIDWDFASPAPTVFDVAHAAWQFVPLAHDDECSLRGWTEPPDRLARLRVLCDAYGLSPSNRRDFAGVVAERMQLTIDGMHRFASDGIAAFEALVRDGIPARVQGEIDWVQQNAVRIDASLVD